MPLEVGHLKIVADSNVLYAVEAFGRFGEVRVLPPDRITAESVRDADILLARSTVKVNAGLLDGSRVRFIASPIIGVDHVDFDYIKARGIEFANSPGCNANSVAEYVMAALIRLAAAKGVALEGLKLGVIGVGNVGGRVSAKAEALGMEVLWNDPPRRRETGDPRFLPLDDVLRADIVTLHVPLTFSGPDRTYRLADGGFFRKMRPGAWFLNTSRGPVVDEAALLRNVAEGRIGTLVLDVWDGEPRINLELLNRAEIATPHIAGYSFDAKVNGTVMIYRATCRFLGVEPEWDPAPLLPPVEQPLITVAAGGRRDEEVLQDVVSRAYDITVDDRSLRRMADQPPEARAGYFRKLRANYRVRREFPNFRVVVDGGSRDLAGKISGLGFSLDR